MVRWIVNAGVLGAPTTISLPSTEIHNATSVVAYPLTIDSNPDFFVNSTGQSIRKYNADGTTANEELTIVGGASNDFKYFQVGREEYIAVFQYSPSASRTDEQAALVEATGGLGSASTVSKTPKLGNISNGNDSGGVGVKTGPGNTITVYTLAANNGVSGTTLLLSGTVLSNQEFLVSDASIYPNPASNDFQVTLSSMVHKNAEATIYDLNGRQIKTSKLISKIQSIYIRLKQRSLYS